MEGPEIKSWPNIPPVLAAWSCRSRDRPCQAIRSNLELFYGTLKDAMLSEILL
ncbi:MAG: hypothetical protein ABSF77_08920 [Spirochaetia bacterium]|jgi:hypothetical protein